MPRILLVEDDLLMVELLTEFLDCEGFQVDHAPDGPSGLKKIIDTVPDLVILDMMMPGMNGLEVCRRVRQHYQGPILMLTAVDEDLNEVTALNTGIDDYITKPFRSNILMARIRSLLRRAGNQEDDRGKIQVQDLVMNRTTRTVTVADQELDISDAEFELLWYMIGNMGKVLSRDEIYRAIKGVEYDGLDRAIDMRISGLRKKFKALAPERTYIKTVWGQGYLVVPH
ncbi:Response regulator transcription factor [Sulfidibacter corallicola]|uniref:Response regulator transcription factor n=1 Tax=Sulfidibacter corallicola TaxID=2818388 RepID=A0A8A4TR04_SULCO|nr:response regulator transcription factor [Sulfidibacter corallicola]QTD51401.1 response regulator transcription factor [Sulfidibacter corallicola]